MAKKKKVTAPAEEIAALINEGGIAVELPTEPKQDHVPIEIEELPLLDEVLLNEEDLPKEDEIEIGEASLYDEDVEVIDSASAPVEDAPKEWVSDPALVRKVEGYRDTLNGTLYYGVKK